jgi:integral membrane protein
MNSIFKFLSKVDNHSIYTDAEAWMLFKVSAIAEAGGWVLLLYGIAAERYHWLGYGYALPIGGTIHGMLFIAYLLIVVTAYSDLGWPRWKALLGVMMSIAPIGTLVFEMWESHQRRKRANVLRKPAPSGSFLL